MAAEHENRQAPASSSEGQRAGAVTSSELLELLRKAAPDASDAVLDQAVALLGTVASKPEGPQPAGQFQTTSDRLRDLLGKRDDSDGGTAEGTSPDGVPSEGSVPAADGSSDPAAGSGDSTFGEGAATGDGDGSAPIDGGGDAGESGSAGDTPAGETSGTADEGTGSSPEGTGSDAAGASDASGGDAGASDGSANTGGSESTSDGTLSASDDSGASSSSEADGSTVDATNDTDAAPVGDGSAVADVEVDAPVDKDTIKTTHDDPRVVVETRTGDDKKRREEEDENDEVSAVHTVIAAPVAPVVDLEPEETVGAPAADETTVADTDQIALQDNASTVLDETESGEADAEVERDVEMPKEEAAELTPGEDNVVREVVTAPKEDTEDTAQILQTKQAEGEDVEESKESTVGDDGERVVDAEIVDPVEEEKKAAFLELVDEIAANVKELQGEEVDDETLKANIADDLIAAQEHWSSQVDKIAHDYEEAGMNPDAARVRAEEAVTAMARQVTGYTSEITSVTNVATAFYQAEMNAPGALKTRADEYREINPHSQIDMGDVNGIGYGLAVKAETVDMEEQLTTDDERVLDRAERAYDRHVAAAQKEWEQKQVVNGQGASVDVYTITAMEEQQPPIGALRRTIGQRRKAARELTAAQSDKTQIQGPEKVK